MPFTTVNDSNADQKEQHYSTTGPMPFRHRQDGGDLSAVFIHAGAGYHSHSNEKFHLNAVNDAAKTAMTILKNGGTAVDAVEMAVRVLEDREITNAGYGSNLTIEGVVECDATVIDHFGRSGAVGAVAQIKNPVSLARVVLEASTKPLSLQRVPPNLLVGQGATDFAADMDLPILPNDFLVSDTARSRFNRWTKDLKTVEEREQRKSSKRKSPSLESTEQVPIGSNAKHTPPMTPDTELGEPVPLSELPTVHRPLAASDADLPKATLDSHSMTLMPTIEQLPTLAHDPNDHYDADSDTFVDDRLEWLMSAPKRTKINGSYDGSEDYIDAFEAYGLEPPQGLEEDTSREDLITDTVGAIAIDGFGDIAAASSSGGIGMKHKGRCGPAALVGIGTAVIPIDPADADQVCVATVTSGTGEHMATTCAAATAADRVYFSVRKTTGRLESCSDDEALKSVIENDFAKHPGVLNSPCAAALGVLAVKKTKHGIYFHFGHNTDSFAIASMHSEERKPVCVMSRSQGNCTIAMGGRASRSKYARRR